MAYTTLDTEFFTILANQQFYTPAQIRQLCIALRRCDFSVVSSRRTAHVALTDLLNTALLGYDYFSLTLRFPSPAVLLSDYDSEVSDTITSLAACLSYRSTTEAKDTASVTTANSQAQNRDVKISIDQGLQDNTKRFEELTKNLCKLASRKDLLWTQIAFETRTRSTWA